MKKLLLVLCLVAGTLLCVCASSSAATKEEHDLVWYRLHLGLGIGDMAVSTQTITRFIDAEITSAFPDGFTIIEARGQWKSPEHGLIRERTIVIDVQCDDTEDNQGKIDAIAERYIEKFRAAQASLYVKRMTGVSATLFYTE